MGLAVADSHHGVTLTPRGAGGFELRSNADIGISADD
jgi:hypothetical protein